MSTLRVDAEYAPECPQCGRRQSLDMSASRSSRLKSLILDKICNLDYVSRAGYRDDGREVTVVVIHDSSPDRDDEMFLEIGSRGREVGREMRDRMITPLAIQDGPDLPKGVLVGYRSIYRRGRMRRANIQRGARGRASTTGASVNRSM